MRKVLTFAVAAMMIVAIVGAASAAVSETAWRVSLKVDNGASPSAGYGGNLSMGVATNTTDGLDTAPGTDAVTNFSTDITNSTRWAVSTIGGDLTKTYSTNIMSNASPYTYPRNHKIWNIFIAAMPGADNQPMRLNFLTTTALPATTRNGLPVFFELKMINNKGIVGAPANGTKWNVPIPAVHTSSVPWWSIDTAQDINGQVWGNLPIIKASTASSTAWINEGYEMQFRMVPEPSSLLAMGSGLAGLIGFAVRRRRA